MNKTEKQQIQDYVKTIEVCIKALDSIIPAFDECMNTLSKMDEVDIETMKTEQESIYEDMSENAQQSEKGEKLQEALDNLDVANTNLEEFSSSLDPQVLDTLKDKLQDALDALNNILSD